MASKPRLPRLPRKVGQQRGSKPGRKAEGIQWRAASVIEAAQTAAPGSFLRLVPTWLHDLAVQQYSPATCHTYGAAMGLFAQWCAEREVYQAVQITRAVMEAYQRFMFYLRSGNGRGPSGTQAAAAPTGGLPLTNVTQRARLVAVDRFYAWAVRRGHVPANPAADLDYPRKSRPLPELLTADEVAAVLGCCDLETLDGIRDRAFLEVLYSTGLRRMEALNLDLDDIDAQRGVVRVIEGKGRKDRYCPIGKRALSWVARYTTEVRPQWCRHGQESRLFLGSNGKAQVGNVVGSRIFRLMRQAGIHKRGACHLFRHSFATHLLENGCDIRLIGTMLGHEDLSSTAIYTRVGVATLVKAHAAFHPSSSCQMGGMEASRAGDSPAGEAGQNAGEVTP